jgi:ParB family chromosome partitioning protein
MTKSLGRGLSALIGGNDLEEDEDSVVMGIAHQRVIEVAIEDIMPGNFQPRKFFLEESLKDLAESIKINGVILPLIAREIGRTGKYQIIAGERRWRASKLAGNKTVPVLLKNLEDKVAIETALIENIQRQDLTVIEEAEGYARLIEEFSYTQEQLSQRLGKSRSHIANMLRILSLPAELKDMVNAGKLSMGHARALVSVDNNIEMAKDIVSRGLNVRDTEKMIKKLSKSIDKKNNIINESEQNDDTRSIELYLSQSLAMQVKLYDTGEGGGVMNISFHTLEQLNILIEKLSYSSNSN